jgi:hypothetical protein
MPKRIYTARRYESAQPSPTSSPLQFSARRDGDGSLELTLFTRSTNLSVTLNRAQFLEIAATMSDILGDWSPTEQPVQVIPLPSDPITDVTEQSPAPVPTPVNVVVQP